MNNQAMFRIGYGLYVVTANDGKDNGCIINTFSQITSEPNRVVLAVNKMNYTHDMIMATGKFNVSMLTTSTPFSLFERFGFQSGKDVDKFADGKGAIRSENGLLYLTEHTNAYISGQVVATTDFGTHTLFIADVTDGEVLNDETSVTYDFYMKSIKPKPKKTKKKGWRCRICGYVYEGDELPKDYVCPICKHGAEDFEPIPADEPQKDLAELAGSRTEANLTEAFAGESMARNKYTFFAERARQDGFEEIAGIFEETAYNEKEHAKLWFQQLHGGAMTGTAENLLAAASGEMEEWSDMYPRMAEEAREEGFHDIAELFERVGAIEKLHEARYRKLLAKVEQSTVFSAEEEITWICRNCGYEYVGKNAPTICPICSYGQSYFEKKVR